MVLPLLFASPVLVSASASTFTIHISGTLVFPVTPVTCSNGVTLPGGTLSAPFSGVVHLTNTSSGGMKFTSTLHGTFLVVGDNGVNFTGHFMLWEGGVAHATSAGFEFGFTNNFNGQGTDGSHALLHFNGQLTVNANGVVTANVTDTHCR